MQSQQRSSIRQPIRVTKIKPPTKQSIQNDMASTTTEQSGTKSIQFLNTPKIKLKQSLPKTSQIKMKQTPNKPLYSPQQNPQFDLMNSPISESLPGVEPIQFVSRPPEIQEEQTCLPLDPQVSVRGMLQREFFSPEQLRQQQEQKKKMKEILDQQIQEKQQRVLKEKEQRQLEQKLENDRIEQEILKEQEDLKREKNKIQKYQFATQANTSPNNDRFIKTKIATEIRSSKNSVAVQPEEMISYDILQQLMRDNEQLKQENHKKDTMIEYLQKNTEQQQSHQLQQQQLTSSKSTQFLIKTNTLRGITKSSQEKKSTFQNRLPEITTPQPHFTHSKQVKSSNLENKQFNEQVNFPRQTKNRGILMKDEDQNWSFGKPEEFQQPLQVPQLTNKNLYILSNQKIQTNQDQQDDKRVFKSEWTNFNSGQEKRGINDWNNINPGFTFCSSMAEQLKLNPKTFSKIKQNPKLPKEFQIMPLKSKFFI